MTEEHHSVLSLAPRDFSVFSHYNKCIKQDLDLSYHQIAIMTETLKQRLPVPLLRLQTAKAGQKPAFRSGLHYHWQRRKIRFWKKKKGTVDHKKLKNLMSTSAINQDITSIKCSSLLKSIVNQFTTVWTTVLPFRKKQTISLANDVVLF